MRVGAGQADSILEKARERQEKEDSSQRRESERREQER